MEAPAIDAAERELMAETLRRLAEELDGAQLTEALDEESVVVVPSRWVSTTSSPLPPL